jgi:uncharacterized damage-inducible protein DinB
MVATAARRGTEGTLLARILEEAYRRRTWNGTNLLQVLRDVGPQEAAWVPPRGKHSIAGIVLHCAYWKHVVRGRLDGQQRKKSFPIAGSDWFDVPTTLSSTDWKGYLVILAREHARLLGTVRALDRAGALGGTGARSRVPQIYGVAMHDVYHTGQIAQVRAQYRRRRARGGSR